MSRNDLKLRLEVWLVRRRGVFGVVSSAKSIRMSYSTRYACKTVHSMEDTSEEEATPLVLNATFRVEPKMQFLGVLQRLGQHINSRTSLELAHLIGLPS